MKTLFHIILLVLSALPLIAQIDDMNLEEMDTLMRLDTVPSSDLLDTTSILNPLDTIASTGRRDTIPPRNTTKSAEVKFADSSLESEITYGAVDSQWYDNKNKLMYLYGEAYVNYQDKELEADLIILDMENKIAEAKISNLKKTGKRPVFRDAGKEYQYGGLKYNFENEKGIVTDAITKEGEFIVHGETTKYVGAGSDKYTDGDVVYNANSLITTCNHDHPHFGFKTKKLKVIPDQVAVSGPANLHIAGVPTPFWIPFGFFPLTQGTSSGLIFPQGYQFYTQQLGFGLAGLGWYFPINDYVHTRFTVDAYTKGTFGFDWNTSYAQKYKYRGNIDIGYDNFVTPATDGLSKISRRGYNFKLRHNQDAKAHPYINFGGDISIVGNNNTNRVNNDAQSVLTNTYRSNFSYTHQMPSTPFSFRLGLQHDQNTQTRKMNITLPDMSLKMTTIYPFEKKNQGGNEKKWYEKVAFGYDNRMRVFTTTTDTTLFTQETLDNVRSGIEQNANISLSTRVFKYFNLVPSINYEEIWVANTVDKFTELRLDTVITEADTILGTIEEREITLRDTLITDVVSDLAAYRTYSAGINLSTQIFGTKTFKRGPIRGVRHLIKPTVGFRYAPDRSDLLDTIQYFDNVERIEVFSKFDQGPFGSPNFNKLQSQLTYSIGNVIEFKYFSKKDSTEKKFKLFDNFTFNGSRNFAADSLKWSTNSLSSTTRLFNGITQISSSWTFDPYLESNGRRIATTVFSDRKRLLRLERGSISVSNRISFKKLKEKIEKRKADRTGDRSDKPEEEIDLSEGADLGVNEEIIAEDSLDRESRTGARPGSEVERAARKKRSLLNLVEKLSLRHELRYQIVSNDGVKTSEVSSHTLALSGGFDLTDNWSINFGNLGYDFKNKGLSYTAVNFTRKLHCWNMSVSWYPNRGNTYSFFIGVNSSNLSFLKYNYGQNNTDGFFGGF